MLNQIKPGYFYYIFIFLEHNKKKPYKKEIKNKLTKDKKFVDLFFI